MFFRAVKVLKYGTIQVKCLLLTPFQPFWGGGEFEDFMCDFGERFREVLILETSK